MNNYEFITFLSVGVVKLTFVKRKHSVSRLLMQ